MRWALWLMRERMASARVGSGMRTRMKARRTLTEGALTALAVKTGRRPSMAENANDTAMDATESRVAIGEPVYHTALLSALFTGLDQL